MKLFIKIAVSVIIVFIVIIGSGIFFITRGLNAGKNVSVSKVDMASVEDGSYVGKYNSGRWTNELKVSVKDHKITDISVIKDVMIPKQDWTAEIFRRVIQKQNTDVDTISGATVTSKAYLKSIEDALSKK